MRRSSLRSTGICFPEAPISYSHSIVSTAYNQLKSRQNILYRNEKSVTKPVKKLRFLMENRRKKNFQVSPTIGSSRSIFASRSTRPRTRLRLKKYRHQSISSLESGRHCGASVLAERAVAGQNCHFRVLDIPYAVYWIKLIF